MGNKLVITPVNCACRVIIFGQDILLPSVSCACDIRPTLIKTKGKVDADFVISNFETYEIDT